MVWFVAGRVQSRGLPWEGQSLALQANPGAGWGWDSAVLGGCQGLEHLHCSTQMEPRDTRPQPSLYPVTNQLGALGTPTQLGPVPSFLEG